MRFARSLGTRRAQTERVKHRANSVAFELVQVAIDLKAQFAQSALSKTGSREGRAGTFG